MIQKLSWWLEMTGLSNHTLLMNMIIGLCKKEHGWQSVLRDLGYEVDWIEPHFINSEGKKVVPDLMLTSNKLLHSLIVECKGGKTLSMDQIDRLSKLEIESIADRTSVYDVKRLKMDVCFAVFEGYLKDILSILDNLFPLLVFSNAESVKLRKLGKFKLKQLNSALSHEIQLGSFPPTGYIPFTDEDDEDLIAMYILQELVSRAIKLSEKDTLKFDVDDLLSSIHPLWKKLDETQRKN